MLKNVPWPEDRAYRSGSSSEPFQFYLDGLIASKNLDLLLGYFSSSAINVLSLGFAKFISCGGTLRMIVNDILSEQDKEAILEGQKSMAKNPPIDFNNLIAIKDTLDAYGTHFFECLSWLIAHNRIQIKVIRPKDGKGISHYKSGIFSDGENKVGFKASCNFTSYGLLENLEEIETYLTWENGRSNKFIKKQTEYFDNIFDEKADFVDYVDVAEVKVAIQTEFGNKDINELLVQESDLLARKRSISSNKKTAKALSLAEERVEEYLTQPRFPFPEGPREYQKDAYNNWTANNYQGIFAMATGSGKTITSLNCLLQETKKNQEKIYHALILVPTITLVSQWEDEAKAFNFRDIIKVSSKDKWESELATTLSIAKRIPTSFIVITTYASFIKDRFNKYINQFPSDTILIADEAHNIGSPSVVNRLTAIPFQKRIGLSATPKRIYDLEGSAAMENFFNDKEPYTYSFTMERAIEEGILCKYYYYPHIVHLTDL
ncbi:MAG TPA: DEAD/DEAH box helicase family protein, partial [Sphingobacteriaceae bacterium]